MKAFLSFPHSKPKCMGIICEIYSLRRFFQYLWCGAGQGLLFTGRGGAALVQIYATTERTHIPWTWHSPIFYLPGYVRDIFGISLGYLGAGWGSPGTNICNNGAHSHPLDVTFAICSPSCNSSPPSDSSLPAFSLTTCNSPPVIGCKEVSNGYLEIWAFQIDI